VAFFLNNFSHTVVTGHSPLSPLATPLTNDIHVIQQVVEEWRKAASQGDFSRRKM